MTNGAPLLGAPLKHRYSGEGVRHIYDEALGSATIQLHSIALDYAARGFAVFPCLEKSKAPAVRHGFYAATTNPATIRKWFNSFHRYNLAIATGIASGIWVFDVDGSIGAHSLAGLEDQYNQLPETLTSITAHGCHLWFRLTRPMRSSVGQVGAGLDVRADGGYVLAPPSVHPDGPVYRWTNARDIAVAPAWLVRLALPKPAPLPPLTVRRHEPSGTSSFYGLAALEQECRLLACVPRGQRNHALNRASFALHQLVAGGELGLSEVRDCLIAAAIANGLMTDPDNGPRSVEKTIASGARAGLHCPRSRPA